MASSPARVMSIVRRAAERGDGCTGGSRRSKPPVIDLANNRLKLNFILPIRLLLHCSKFRGQAGLHLRHGYRRLATAGLGPPMPQNARVERQEDVEENGGGYGGTAVGGDAEIGLAGAAWLGGYAGPRGDR